MQSKAILCHELNATVVWFTFCVSAFTLPTFAHCQDRAERSGAVASKEMLIETLDSLFPLLASGDFQKASEYFILPPNFKPEMLERFIELQELSLNGIRVLERDATFGRATDIFGAERAQALADRARVDVSACFGFKHQTQAATAEVLAVWKDETFKLFRLDDVGKLQTLPPSASKPAMTKEEVLQKLSEFEAAVEADPNDVAARANYAMALNQIGNFPAAWLQLMAAQRLSPSHAGIAKGIEAVWAQFAQLDLFTVGIPQASIEGLLGTPTQTIDRKTGSRWIYGFYAIDFDSIGLHETIDLRGTTDALFQPTEIVSVDLDGRGWRVGSRTKSANLSTALLFLPGESFGNWTEQIEVQRILGATSTEEPREIAEKMFAQIKAVAPESRGKTLLASEDSVTIAVTLRLPGADENRHQLVRLFKGPTDVHRLAYTLKGKEPSQEAQEKWFEIFQAAKLDSVQPAIDSEK